MLNSLGTGSLLIVAHKAKYRGLTVLHFDEFVDAGDTRNQLDVD
jgi:hypothetical protein